MQPPVPRLGDDVVRLRPPDERDVDSITAACQDPAVPRFTRVPSPYTRDDAVEFVKRTTHAWRHGGAELSLAIADAATDELLGMCGVLRLDRAPHVAEIGYWVAPEARGRGVATRAVVLVSRWAVCDLGIGRLELMTLPENEASQRVAERAGFTREGRLRSYADLGPRRPGRCDVVMFSLLPGDVAG